ncbi:MAG TPA: LTA synthase family protein, partial [Candidatus Sphingobacterium stercorigallinarum]|nr:LTA synthase family protein [Candidatus Sphingobacterium stercorigallinarum]
MIKLKSYVAPYLGMTLRFFALLILYAGLRVGFYAFNNAHFPQVSFAQLLTMLWGGLRFDLVALLYLNVGYILLAGLPLKIKYK